MNFKIIAQEKKRKEEQQKTKLHDSKYVNSSYMEEKPVPSQGISLDHLLNMLVYHFAPFLHLGKG